MSKWRVSYSGFAWVEAETADEAEELFWAGASETDEYSVDEVEEF